MWWLGSIKLSQRHCTGRRTSGSSSAPPYLRYIKSYLWLPGSVRQVRSRVVQVCGFSWSDFSPISDLSSCIWSVVIVQLLGERDLKFVIRINRLTLRFLIKTVRFRLIGRVVIGLGRSAVQGIMTLLGYLSGFRVRGCRASMASCLLVWLDVGWEMTLNSHIKVLVSYQ